MDQQSKHKKADINLDLSGDSQDGDQSHQRVDVHECKLRTEMEKKKKLVDNNNMADEEMKIRGELEIEVERNLEEEIKDGIYSLALRLHRLYQHQKERNSRGEAISEVNISIRMEGGTKIEIKEMKNREAQQEGRPWSSRSERVKPMPVSMKKKFNWAASLRSGIDHTAEVNKKSGRHIDNNKATEAAVWKW